MFFCSYYLKNKKYVLLFLDEPSGKAERLLSKK